MYKMLQKILQNSVNFPFAEPSLMRFLVKSLQNDLDVDDDYFGIVKGTQAWW